MIAVAAQELGISREQVRVMPTSTDKVPNTSATAASCGTDLNGAAVKNACEKLRERLLPVASEMLKAKLSPAPAIQNVIFGRGIVWERNHPRTTLTFAEVVKKTYL